MRGLSFTPLLAAYRAWRDRNRFPVGKHRLAAGQQPYQFTTRAA
jgi:hypothetical protein